MQVITGREKEQLTFTWMEILSWRGKKKKKLWKASEGKKNKDNGG